MVDVEAVRGLARQVSATAQDTRAVAVRAGSARGVQWQSVAADRWRRELAEEAARVSRAADRLDDAVRALHAHADAVERRLAEIAAAARAAEELLERARRAAADAWP